LSPAARAQIRPEPDHYHIIYAGIPRRRVAYATQKEAYQELKRLGDAAEPNVEWYEDGRVSIETRIHDRTGLHWVELEVAGCVGKQCTPKRLAALGRNTPRHLVLLR
jgi:hypothetical protein